MLSLLFCPRLLAGLECLLVLTVNVLQPETREIVFETGCYELKNIIDKIAADKDHQIHKTVLDADYIAMRVGIKSTWSVDFTGPDSIGSLLPRFSS